MKICQIGTGARAIGENSETAVELVMHNLSGEMIKIRNEVYIIDIEDKQIKRDKNLKYYVIKIPFLQKIYPKPGSISHLLKKLIFSIKSAFLLYELNKKKKFDIIHIQNQYPGFFILLLKRLIKNSCLVYTSHTPFWTLDKDEFFKKFYLKTFLERICMKMTDEVIAVSHSQKKGILEKVSINPKKIEVIQNGVDLNKFFPGKSRLENIKENRDMIIVLSVARISKIKNQMLLIKSIPEIIKKEKNIKFLFIGQLEDANYLQEINRFIKDKKIENYVQILGPIKNDLLPEDYRLADVFISTSNAEGFPLTVLEAMASGCAMILSDILPHKEISKNNEIVYFKKNNLKDFINKLLTVIENKNKRENLRKKAFETAKKFFSWRSVALKNIEIYKDIIKRKNRGI